MNAPILEEPARIEAALFSISPDLDRDSWWRVAAALKHEMGEAGLDLFDRWSQGGTSYNATDSRDTWKSTKAGGGITIATLYAMAKDHGFDPHQHKAAPIDPAEQERRRAERAERAERDKAEQAERQRHASKAASLAMMIIQMAAKAGTDHPYLVRKGIAFAGMLLEMAMEQLAALIGYHPKAKGKPLVGRILIACVSIDEEISTLEMIDEDGQKSALSGGAKAGGYWSTNPLPTQGDGTTVLICEGVATAISAHAATGHTALAALSCANLQAVARAVRAKLATAEIVICTDLGNGQTYAERAAAAVCGKLAVPAFLPDARIDGKPPTDFNDLHQLAGAVAVRAAVERAAAAATETNQVDHYPPAETTVQADPDVLARPAPQPLIAKIEPEPYPLEALPPAIRAAVEEVQGFVRAPVPLVVSCALSALSLAVQPHTDVQRAEKLQGPSSLFLLTIADSGERKSSCDRLFMQAIRDFERAQEELHKPAIQAYKAVHAAWSAKRDGVQQRIKEAVKKGKPTTDFEDELRDLEMHAPEAPRVPRLLYESVTPEKLAFELGTAWPAGGIVSAEAGIVFGGHAMGSDSVMRNLAQLNQLWDGAPLRVDRRTSESFSVRGARLTVSLQIQEATLRSFFDRAGLLARGTGFLARFLIALPQSTQGTRLFREAPTSCAHLDAFNHRITELLEQPAPITKDGALAPAMLSLTPAAKTVWVAFHDDLERDLASGGDLHQIRDVASKAADNAARLAALFHVYSGTGTAIDDDIMARACTLVAWHLSESRRFFGELALPQQMADACRLDDWLLEHCRREGTHMVSKRDAQRLGPLRDGGKLDAAITELASLDRLTVRKDGKRITLWVHPALMEGLPA
ncbi:DUF3987 domain-containing protein [Cupriavidus oxalaticus]|uniref:DUF3987 domain-containing protein n=1 Tax=Cupriavidus oxalaticus TaxID=96344 RepID=UPI003F7398F4